ncbi:dephospho-CoA kinase [Malassezia vespertilionis]|uniref:dephospho-CoA kinase n=1 Tax=Malassezia vespertilionis TaxID=2020962 RepID=UPI0024B04ADC|nr:dephospho-CoA kinase [Malassezia vespertilionis]WFD07684.1 dephospho-CoA kinase [Malassezia vespertilionis]
MFVVGLTGGIATGKSTVTTLLRSHGLPVVDLDDISRVVVEKGTPTLGKLVSAFGKEILNEDGTLNRAELGRIVFGKPEKVQILNRITHTAIRRRMAWYLFLCWITGSRRVVVDSPLLIEAGLWKWVGEVVLVYTTEEQQFARMLHRDQYVKQLTVEDARARLSSQVPIMTKTAYADVILDNSMDAVGFSSPLLRDEVEAMVQRWDQEDHAFFGTISWLLCWLLPPVGLLWGFIVVCLHTRRLDIQQQQQASYVKASKRE